MTRKKWIAPALGGMAVLTVLVIWRTASAGPPLICWPVAIGDAHSIPWGDDAFDKGPSDVDDVVRETLHALRPDADILVRMETIRRATIYLADERALAHQLLENLMARALDAEANDEPNAMAWFDAGYLVQAYDQMYGSRRSEWSFGVASNVPGYAWVQRAIELTGDDARLHFAAALMTAMDSGPSHEKHLKIAMDNAGKDPLLQKNLKQFDELFTQLRPHFTKQRN